MTSRWLTVILAVMISMLMMMIVKVEADISSPRYGHGAVLINQKIYIYGGRKVASTIDPYATDSLNVLNEFIILDVSKSFKTDDLPWEINNDGNGTNPHLYNHGVTSNGNDLMILFEGISDATNINNSVLWYCHTDSSKTFQASNVNTTLLTIPRRFSFGMVSDKDDAYIIGGIDLTQTTVSDAQGIIDIGITSIESDTAISTFISANVASYDHTATLLNGKIYIIGGMTSFVAATYADMSSIKVYNTFDHTLIPQQVNGDIPGQRGAHRAVGYNNTIIIHGGFNGIVDTNDLFKLDVLSLTWEKLNISGPDPGARYSHTFTLVGNYIIGTYGLSKTSTSLSNIFILDLNTLSWTNEFNPPPAGTSTNTPTNNTPTDSSSSSSSSSKLPIIIGIIGGFVILAVLICLSVFCFIKRKRKNEPNTKLMHEDADRSPQMTSLNNNKSYGYDDDDDNSNNDNNNVFDQQSIPYEQHQLYQQQQQQSQYQQQQSPYQQQQQQPYQQQYQQQYQPYQQQQRQPYQHQPHKPYQQYAEEEVDPLNYDTTKIPFGHPKNRQGSVGSDTSKALTFEDQQQESWASVQNYLKGSGGGTNTIVVDSKRSGRSSPGLFGGRSSPKKGGKRSSSEHSLESRERSHSPVSVGRSSSPSSKYNLSHQKSDSYSSSIPLPPLPTSSPSPPPFKNPSPPISDKFSLSSHDLDRPHSPLSQRKQQIYSQSSSEDITQLSPQVTASSSSTLSPSNFVPPIPRPLSIRDNDDDDDNPMKKESPPNDFNSPLFRTGTVSIPSSSSPGRRSGSVSGSISEQQRTPYSLRSTSRMSDRSNQPTRSNTREIIDHMRSGTLDSLGSLHRATATSSPTGIMDDDENITGGSGSGGSRGRLFPSNPSNPNLGYESD
ncbi:hypothetical protein Glove_86g146 [Diversispora epigaea]|uniref:Galactose oxidase n=1 Tax=Diversispora epigaea TaxID=1348612 RepID=A0A397J6F3_9GLOM|nr:hypothetical protein Glove_86g146 [Diversispora epigaea]